MARPSRIQFPGALYHVTSRGVPESKIFLDDPDREVFLSLLGSVAHRMGWLVHAYCLMASHYHVLTETPAANLAAGVQQLNGLHARTANRIRGRRGHLFEARYHAVLVEKESHLLEVARYIVLNPVRAGLCSDPAAWPWSSYRATAGFADPPRLLTTDWLLGQLAQVRSEAQERYRAFVADGLARQPWRPPPGRAVGRPEFIRRFVEAACQAPVSGTGA